MKNVLETIIPFFPLIILPIVIFLFLRIILKSNKKLDIEDGLTPIFTTRCGGTTGGVWYKGPFIRVAIYDDFVVLKHYSTVVLYYDEMEAAPLETQFGVVGKLLHIHHYRDDVGAIVLIASKEQYQKIQEIIKDRLENRPESKKISRAYDPVLADQRKEKLRAYSRSAGFSGFFIALLSFIPIIGFIFAFFGFILCIVWWKNGGATIFWLVLMGLVCNVLLYPYLGLY